MPRPKSDRPAYCLHQRSGNAYTTIDGRQIQLGRHGTPESREAYDRLIGQWLLHGRSLPQVAGDGPTVDAIIARFWEHCQNYYVHSDGTPTQEVDNFAQAIRFLRRLYGSTPAAAFGPMALKAVREAMIRPGEWKDRKTGETVKFNGWARKNANRMVARIKLIFKWSVENELVPPSVHHGLTAVAGLKAGRSEARETAPIKPPPESMVDTVLPLLPLPIRAIVELEGITGARGGELIVMRGRDLDMRGEIWIYRPPQHKTLHHGHSREIPLGKRCREIIEPYLKLNPSAFLFSPSDSEDQRRKLLTVARTTPGDQGNAIGTNRSDAPKVKPGDRYTPASYRRAIIRACQKAFPAPEELRIGKVKTGPERTRFETNTEWRKRLGDEKWAQLKEWQRKNRFHPHQLRHAAATRLRKLFGLEAAGVVLGQRTMAATLMYAEQDRELATRVMGEIG